jgi:hypothetical protein
VFGQGWGRRTAQKITDFTDLTVFRFELPVTYFQRDNLSPPPHRLSTM